MAKSFRDRFFLTRLTRDEKKMQTAFLIIGILFLLVLANTAYITVLSLQKQSVHQVSIIPTATPLPTAVIEPTNLTPTSVPIVQVQQVVQPITKEYFIPFGAGSSTASDWTDVPGLTAQIDFGKYPNIKEVHFEASVSIPTANETASVRLFNETDMHPVWYSEITLYNGQFISSNPVIYDTGVKTYQVQMKTSLQFLANLVQSRIHVILN